jgi:hypothetical protein
MSLLSTTFFPEMTTRSPESVAHLEQMVKRWQSYLEQGTFVLSTNINKIDDQKVDGVELCKFWTGPWPYWNMKERSSQLWEWLHTSDLVIFKVCRVTLGADTGLICYLQGDLKYVFCPSFSMFHHDS